MFHNNAFCNYSSQITVVRIFKYTEHMKRGTIGIYKLYISIFNLYIQIYPPRDRMIFLEALVFSFWLITIVNITVWGRDRLRKVNLGTH